MSPFEALYGRQPVLPVDVGLLPPPTITPTSPHEILRLNADHLARLQDRARTTAQRVRRAAATKLNRHLQHSPYAVGDYVYAFAPTPNSAHGSFERHWHGPYRLVHKILIRAEWILQAIVEGRPSREPFTRTI